MGSHTTTSLVILALGVAVLGRIAAPSSYAVSKVALSNGPPNSINQTAGGDDTTIFAWPETADLDFNINNPANDDLWKKYIDKGSHLNCIMSATDAGAGFLMQDPRKPPSAASPWQGDLDKEMQTWYWHESYYDEGWECDFEAMRLGATFAGLGLNAKPKFDDDGQPADGDNECWSITHYDEEDEEDPNAEFPQMKPVKDQKYKVGGKEYMATGAYYQFAVNQKGGAIIGKNIQSPAFSVPLTSNWGRKANPGELPELRFASDIFWGYWFRDNPNVKNLRVYVGQNIINDDTVLLAARAVKEAKDPKDPKEAKLLPWPGHVFDGSSDAGKALIASPIGATIANMISRHKAELGVKHISKVIVVTNDLPVRPRKGERPKEDLNILFQIEDVPKDDITDDKPKDEKPPPGQRRSLSYERGEQSGGGLRVHMFKY